MRRVLVLTAAALLTAAAAAPAAPWPRNLFVLAESENPSAGGDGIHDFAEAPDGSVLLGVGSTDAGQARVDAVAPSGRRRSVVTMHRGSGRAGIGLLRGRNGGFLAVDGWNNQVVRFLPSGRREILAGTGEEGFAGDGGPAEQALLRIGASELADLDRMPDGSIVFADAWNNRVRRIRPDGTIETLAGSGPEITPFASCDPFGGDGGLATQAALCSPTDVLALPDGGVVIAGGHGRLRRVGADGKIATIAGTGQLGDASSPPREDGMRATEAALVLAGGLARAGDGDLLFSEHNQVSAIGADGRLRTVLKLSPSVLATEPERPVQDFTGRRPVSGSVTGIETTREGGLLVAAGNALYLAPAKSRRTLVAIRGARVAERSITVVLDATRAGRATVAVALAGEPVAHTTRRITAGRTRVRVRGPFDAQPHEVRVTVRAARDEVRLHLGTRLPMAYARRLAEWWEEYEEPVAGCRRLSVRRIDCAYGTAAAGCARVESLTLRRTGVLWVRSYGCADPADPYRRRPQWSWWAQPIGAPIP